MNFLLPKSSQVTLPVSAPVIQPRTYTLAKYITRYNLSLSDYQPHYLFSNTTLAFVGCGCYSQVNYNYLDKPPGTFAYIVNV